MKRVILDLEKRNGVGGGRANRLRKDGYIPAIIYGKGMEPAAVQVKASDFREFLATHGKNSVFSTEFASENDFSMLVKDIQYDAVYKKVVHLDFQKVSLDEKVSAVVPVKVIGGDEINRAGRVIAHQLNSVTVECLPQDVPHYLEADISGMSSGHSLTASQLKLPRGVNLVTAPGDIVLSVINGKQDVQVDKVDEPVRPVILNGRVDAKKA